MVTFNVPRYSMSEANTPGQFYTAKISTIQLYNLIPYFSDLNPGIQYGVTQGQSQELWQLRAKHCYGYAVAPEGSGAWCGIAGVFMDFSPDPHFPYSSVAQIEFTAVRPGYPGAVCALYQHIKNDLRNQGVQALVVPRQVSRNEIRARLYQL